MCIIIRNTTGKAIEESVANKCVTINPDGFGIVFLDGKGGHFRTLDMGAAKRTLVTETRPYVAHCRYATVGAVCADGIHPFPLGKGRYLFQNGTVEVSDQSTCDTAQLARALFGLSDTRIHFVLTAIDGCRFAVANGKESGESEIFGKWHKRKGVEYSKSNVLPVKQWKPSKYRGGYTGANPLGYYRDGKWNSYASPKGDRDPTNDSSEWSETVDRGLSYYERLDQSNLPGITTGGTSLVAVYGTLKQGHSNHKVMKTAGGAYVGDGRTSAKYRLCIDGLPYLIRGASPDGHNVAVEVYDVDQAGLTILDSLEGHPDFYRRETIRVSLDGEVGTRSVYAYFVGPEFDNGTYAESY